MKYYKSQKFPKIIGGTGIVAMASCLIIAVGAFAWIMTSKNNNITETPSSDSSNQSYSVPDNSYNSEVSEPEISQGEVVENVNESAEDVPYESQVQPEPQPEKRSFVMPVEGNIVKGFSDTALQYSATYGDMRLHTGIDILCKTGSDVKSVSSGTVKSVTDDATLGRVITIDHGDGIVVKYCGMGSVNVKEGDAVTASTVIGTTGEIPAECTDNPHLHIEAILDEKIISPLKALEFE